MVNENLYRLFEDPLVSSRPATPGNNDHGSLTTGAGLNARAGLPGMQSLLERSSPAAHVNREPAQHRDECLVQIGGTQRSSATGEQQVHQLTGFAVRQSRLCWPDRLSGVDGPTHGLSTGFVKASEVMLTGTSRQQTLSLLRVLSHPTSGTSCPRPQLPVGTRRHARFERSIRVAEGRCGDAASLGAVSPCFAAHFACVEQASAWVRVGSRSMRCVRPRQPLSTGRGGPPEADAIGRRGSCPGSTALAALSHQAHRSGPGHSRRAPHFIVDQEAGPDSGLSATASPSTSSNRRRRRSTIGGGASRLASGRSGVNLCSDRGDQCVWYSSRYPGTHPLA